MKKDEQKWKKLRTLLTQASIVDRHFNNSLGKIEPLDKILKADELRRRRLYKICEEILKDCLKYGKDYINK